MSNNRSVKNNLLVYGGGLRWCSRDFNRQVFVGYRRYQGLPTTVKAAQ
jgi:hypothetical protein